MRARILVVDDDRVIRLVLRDILEGLGARVTEAEDLDTAKEVLSEELLDLVFLDLKVGREESLSLLSEITLKESHPEVVMISAFGTIEKAVEAVKHGAFDFMEKPLSLERIRIVSQRALERLRLSRKRMESEKKEASRHEMVGESPHIKEVKSLIERVAPTNARVMITGETGTGKELVAYWVHNRSRRRDGPYVQLNSAAIPKELLEAELFGHEKGAFTGAIKAKPGKFEVADGGTIFLDEVGDMDLSAQAKLLRVLESGEVERLGATKPRMTDARVLAASNKNLKEMIETGEFREDLYFRLATFPIHLPPLRERGRDVILIAHRFLQQISTEWNAPLKSLSAAAENALLSYSFPGNVRELRNIIERCIILSETDELSAEVVSGVLGAQDAPLKSSLSSLDVTPYTQARKAFEAEYIRSHLARHEWNVSATADALKMDRSSLHRKINEYTIERPE